ncbi:MAG: type 1 glutamine amidotransferase-like domain-containing protein [Halobacteriovoraceae bacterium]|jgi:dipeptidase E|nr:type 1 glutamine amidotransferase-like domain-containing protein [Halobacteriovoraceae bacterium]MBT5094366.1 type 1 glutamine amidotransferase-like domain-containing protein [Halobacteriovoraceae bacterium]
MAIFLTGGGEQEVFQSLDKVFLNSLPAHSKVAILPHASDDHQEVLERIEDYFSHKNVSKFELVITPSESLLDYDAIMIEGGNTFDLIREVRDSAFFDLLLAFHKSGKTIYADSAGAIVLGSDVHTAFLGDDGDEDQLKLQDYRGLDIIHPWCLHAHATSAEHDALQDLLYDQGNPILALAENTGIKIDGDELEVFGLDQLEVVTFSGRQLLAPREKASLTKLQE